MPRISATLTEKLQNFKNDSALLSLVLSRAIATEARQGKIVKGLDMCTQTFKI